MLIRDPKGRVRAQRVGEGAVHSVKKWARPEDLVSVLAAQEHGPQSSNKHHLGPG